MHIISGAAENAAIHPQLNGDVSDTVKWHNKGKQLPLPFGTTGYGVQNNITEHILPVTITKARGPIYKISYDLP